MECSFNFFSKGINTLVQLTISIQGCFGMLPQKLTLIQDPPWAGSLKWPMLIAQTAIQITVIT